MQFGKGSKIRVFPLCWSFYEFSYPLRLFLNGYSMLGKIEIGHIWEGLYNFSASGLKSNYRSPSLQSKILFDENCFCSAWVLETSEHKLCIITVKSSFNNIHCSCPLGLPAGFERVWWRLRRKGRVYRLVNVLVQRSIVCFAHRLLFIF